MLRMLGSMTPSLSLCPSSVYSLIKKKKQTNKLEYCIFICYQTPMCSCCRVRVALQSPGLDAAFPCSVGDLHHWPSLPPALHKECFIDSWLCPAVWFSHYLSSSILPLILVVLSSLWECLITAFGTFSSYGQSCIPHLTSRAELPVSSFLSYRQWLFLQRPSKSLPSFHLTPSPPWSCLPSHPLALTHVVFGSSWSLFVSLTSAGEVLTQAWQVHLYYGNLPGENIPNNLQSPSMFQGLCRTVLYTLCVVGACAMYKPQLCQVIRSPTTLWSHRWGRTWKHSMPNVCCSRLILGFKQQAQHEPEPSFPTPPP